MEARTPEQLPRPIAKRHGSPPSAARWHLQLKALHLFLC